MQVMNGFLLIVLISAFFLSGQATKPPRWDPSYIVSGTLYIPYAEIAEPFYAWFDNKTARSRIDYYGGVVKTYQLSKAGDFGTLLKLAPITTNTELNKMTCLQVNGTAEQRVSVQSILPYVREFELAGTETFLGYQCDKFNMVESVGKKKNVYTLWVRYIKSPHFNGTRMPIPVRYEMRGYNNLLGSHYDHYYLDYDSYERCDIPNEVFDIEPDMRCGAFPGPGAKHRATFNPMMEFVHPVANEHVEAEFGHFKRTHKLQYTKREHERRLNVFRHNLRYINSHNRAHKNYTLAVNHLADRTNDELAALRGFRSTTAGMSNGGKPFVYNVKMLKDTIPEQYDWRLYGAVTPVKDQSVCGSCWSFGTTGHLEGAYFLKTGNLVRLSQQALIDCSWGYLNNGCDGGEDFRVYEWMMHVGGIPTEEEYGPYLGQDGYCHISNLTLVAPIKGFVNVTANDPDAMKIALLKHGPISIAIDASPRSFSFYANGVYYEQSCKNKLDELDHAVLAVGYGKLRGEDYWLVKNSWSTYWGNDGYVLISARDNNCGVLTSPTYVEM